MLLRLGHSVLTVASVRRLSTRARDILNAFNAHGEATFLSAASSKDSIPKLGGLPEVVVTGRANVGKSTLLNAVLNRTNLVRTSKKPGRTKALNFFRVGCEPGALVVVDAPGYGMRGRQEWGEIWEHYINTRRQLRQVCVLINAAHGVTDFDRGMLGDLNERLYGQNTLARRPPVLQPVLTKLDLIKGSDEDSAQQIRAIIKEVSELTSHSLPPILCSYTPNIRIGVDAVRRSMAEACTA